MPDPFTFVGIGNAAIDVICSVSDDFITDLHLPKSSCAFPDRDGVTALEAAILARNITPALEPGGCAANTASVIGALGDRAALIGKTADDNYGRLFAESMNRWRIAHPAVAIDPKTETSTRVYTFITPDFDRTFASYQGAAEFLSPDDVPEDMIANAKCVYIDGYVLPETGGYKTAMHALGLAKKHNVLRVCNPCALSVIDRWPGPLREIMASCDGVICNHDEALKLTGAGDNKTALSILAKERRFAAVTLGEGGAMAMAGDQFAVKANAPLSRPIVNTNGAGDNFAGGFLFGFTKGWDLNRCLGLGLACALNILGETGPRPTASLEELAKAA